MLIVDNISPKPARYVRVPTPENFKSSYHKDKYWEEEIRRWHEGYEGLHGFHYFYVQECKIPDNDGLPIRPRWRECDENAIWEIFECFKKRWDANVFKRREFGLTSIGAGALPFYMMQIYPGAHIGMTSADLDRVSRMFKEKTLTTRAGFHPEIEFPIHQKNETKNNSYLAVTQKIIDHETNEETMLYPDISCPETAKDPKAFSSGRFKYIFVDEWALHPKRQQLLNSLYPTLEKEKVRTGFLLCGGTVESDISPESLNEMRDIVSRSRAGDKVGVIFVPAYAGMSIYTDFEGNIHRIPGTENGWNNKEFATEIIMRERDHYEKIGDISKLNALIKNYPLTIDEVLEGTATGVLPKEIMDMVAKRTREINQKHETVFPEATYRLDYTSNGAITAIPDNNGCVVITEMPRKDLVGAMPLPYIASNDPIPYGDNDIDDGSSDCMVIKNRFTQKYVAYYLERNLDPHYTFTQKTMLQNFYFQAPSMLEMNRGEVVFQTYKAAGALHLLAKKPINLGIKYETSRVYGWYKNKTGAMANGFFITFLKNHLSKQDFKLMMRQLEVFLIENTDLLDAMIGCEVFEEELRRREEKERNRQHGGAVETVRVIKRRPDGTTYYEDVPIKFYDRN